MAEFLCIKRWYHRSDTMLYNIVSYTSCVVFCVKIAAKYDAYNPFSPPKLMLRKEYALDLYKLMWCNWLNFADVFTGAVRYPGFCRRTRVNSASTGREQRPTSNQHFGRCEISSTQREQPSTRNWLFGKGYRRYELILVNEDKSPFFEVSHLHSFLLELFKVNELLSCFKTYWLVMKRLPFNHTTQKHGRISVYQKMVPQIRHHAT